MEYPTWLLKTLQGSLILGLGVLSGVALSLSCWVTPAILRPENSSRSAIAQFAETIDRGGRYLQPSSRIAGAMMLLVALLTSQHPDPEVAWKWKPYSATLFVLVQVAWYEIYFIFPINDIIKAMGAKLEGTREVSLPEAEQKRLRELLLKWEFRHRGRIGIPLFACVASIVVVLI